MARGVPQARWRLISQSGRLSTMVRMRFLPAAGWKAVVSMARECRLAQGVAGLERVDPCG